MTNYIHTIQTQYSDLKITHSKIDEHSNFNTVLHINDNLIFRFPRYKDSHKTLKIETALLGHLQGKTSLSIPDPIYQHLDASLGEAFMGYEIVQGDWVNIYELTTVVNQNTLQQLATQLVDFLTSLHAISTEDLPLQPDVIDQHYWSNLYQRIQDNLYDKIRPDARDEISQLFESYLAQAEDIDLCLIHGDFGTGNILYDPDEHRFTGVIDFGFIAIGDPAIDYSALYGFRGRGLRLFEQLSDLKPEINSFLHRTRYVK